MDRNGLNYSFEFFPPKTEKAESSFWAAMDELITVNPNFVTVTYGAGGSTRDGTKRIVTAIQEKYPIKAAAHFTCVCATREEIDEIARDFWQAGIHHLVALRGDPPEGADAAYTPTPGGYAYADDLVVGMKKIADFEISVAGYPEVHPQAESEQSDLEHLKRKVDAGADRIITQFFWEAECFLRYRDKVADMGIKVPVVPGILPITNFAKTVEFSGKCGTNVPTWLAEKFEGLDERPEQRQQAAQDVAIEQCSQLKDEGVGWFHFYTLNRAALTVAVLKALGVGADQNALAG